jgi:trigger factor
MQSSLNHHTATRKSLDFVVPASEVNEEFSKVITKLTPKVKIPGFRPGKAPKSVLLSRFDREIKSEVVEALVDRHFLAAATAAGVQPISRPALDKVELQEGNDGKFNAQFDVAPQVPLPGYKGLNVVKKKQVIDDEAVAARLEAMREEAAKFIPVEDGAAELGHFVTLDIKVKPQGMKAMEYKDQVIQLADGRPFDQEILGMRVDDTKKFTLTMPEGEANRLMAGKPIAYETVMKDLRAKVVPDLNDEFAKDLGHANGLEDLRAAARKELEENAEADAMTRAHQGLLDQFLDANSFEVPASMVALQLNDYCQEFADLVARQGVDPKKVNWEAYRQSRTRDAERAVRSGYLLQAIGNTEDIQVSDAELEAEIRSFMEERKVQQPFEAFRKKLEETGAVNEIKGRVRTDKIFSHIMAQATVTEELLGQEAFAALKEQERKREAGEPTARFDVTEGQEDEEDGGPARVVSAEPEHVHGPDCDHDHDHDHDHEH